MKECPFRPQTRSTSSQWRTQSLHSQTDVWEELYLLAKKSAKRVKRSEDDRTFHKLRAEFTFTPSITQYRPLTPPLSHDSFTENTILRLRQGHKERQRRNLALTRSLGPNPMQHKVESNKYCKGTFEQFSPCPPSGRHTTTTRKGTLQSQGRDRKDSKSSSQHKQKGDQERDRASKKTILHIDVNFNGGHEGIDVKEGDSAQTLAQIFAQTHRTLLYIP